MRPDDFPRFYHEVHGREPFPWQVRLARQVAERGAWPGVLSLPTASGKTSTLDVAIFTLALQAGKPLGERTAPLRVFFVIDRRLVVDQAAEHARKLAGALRARKSELVSEVAGALSRFGGEPLHVSALRGGLYRDDSWVRAPNQPTVCVSTVDQVGSRLLFRGYGVSEYARPVHAALTGNDALYLVDEAHLSAPFLKTLRSVGRYRGGHWAERPLGGPFHVVEMSATPTGDGEPFVLGDDDHANEELSRRLGASKPARLIEPARFEEEAAELAEQARVGEVKVVGVVVNRVESARDVYSRLSGEPFKDKVLLTGRIRPWDRDALLDRCLSRMRAGRTRQPDDLPLTVVATQTVEVGADLDFDHLITEAAPLPALRQRFGRLDRLGRFGNASGAVLLRKAKGADPIYGESLKEAWEWLQAKAAASKGTVDFGVLALQGLLAGAPSPPVPHAPSLLPAYLDCLAQTSPPPRPSPDVAPFLHGPDALEAADVQFVWRADLFPGREEEWVDVVAAAPPRSRESLSLPIGAARRWLCQESSEVADLEGAGAGKAPAREGRHAVRWAGSAPDASGLVRAADVRPGDTLVVPSTYGGADAFGWSPSCLAPVVDVGDECLNEMANLAPDDGAARPVRFRLYEGFESRLVASPESDEPTPSPTACTRRLRALLEAGEDFGPAQDALLDALLGRPPTDPLLAAVLERLAVVGLRAVAYPSGVILSGRARAGFHQPCGAEDGSRQEDETGEDEGGGTLPPAAVELEAHAKGVVRWVEAFAAGLALDQGVRSALVRAAELHDLGKADWRFQFLLYGGEPGDKPLAKSGREFSAEQSRRVRRAACLPDGFRHEFVSVALIRAHAAQLLADVGPDVAQLVEHLVGVHHGRGRPFVPVIDEGDEAVTLVWSGQALSASANHGLWHLGSGWTDGFWRLLRRYGYWGLAYLEACLRSADAARSREEQLCQQST